MSFETVRQSLNREINICIDGSSQARLQALSSFKSLSRFGQESINDRELITAMAACLKDARSSVRERAVELFKLLASTAYNCSPILSVSVPVLAKQLVVTSSGPVEKCEEVREVAVQLLRQVVVKSEDAALFLDDFAEILSHITRDPSPDVLLESCALVSALSEACPDRIGMLGGRLAAILSAPLKNKRFKVRLAALKALGAILVKAGHGVMDEAIPLVVQFTADAKPNLRIAAVEVSALLLTEHLERVSIQPKLLPVILTMIGDPVESVQKAAVSAIDRVGALYEKDNKNEIADQRAYDVAKVEPLLFAPFSSRPLLGSRCVVRKELFSMKKTLEEGLLNWTDEGRVRGLRFCKAVCIYSEEFITQFLSKEILSPLTKFIMTGENNVSEFDEVCQLIGHYCNPGAVLEALRPLVNPTVEYSPESISASLVVLAKIFEHASSQRQDLYTSLSAFAKSLNHPAVSSSDSNLVRASTAKCIAAVAQSAKGLFDQTGSQFFSILLSLMASGSGADLQNQIDQATTALQTALGCPTREALFVAHFGPSLQEAANDHLNWTSGSHQLNKFIELVQAAKGAVASNIQQVFKVITACTVREKEALLRIRLLDLLHDLVKEPSVISAFNEANLLRPLVAISLGPNLVWRSGSADEACRFASVQILQTLSAETSPVHATLINTLDIPLRDDDPASTIPVMLLPLILSALEDDRIQTRFASLRFLSSLLKAESLQPVHVMKIIHALTIRMDDTDNDVGVGIRSAKPKTIINCK